MKRRHIPPVRKPVKNNLTSGTAKQLSEMLQRGFVQHQQGKIKVAKDIYEQILKINPNHFDALQLLGAALWKLGNPSAAVEFYDRALAINQSNGSVFNNKGLALQDLKKLDEALTSYDKAISLNPQNAEAHNNRGNVLQDLNRFDDSLLSYDKAIYLKPDYAEAHNNRGNTLKYLNRLEESLLAFDKAIQLNPNYAVAYSNRGTALKELNLIGDALESYNKAIILKPDYAEAYWNKSHLLILKGQYKDGWNLYESRLNNKNLKDNYYKFDKIDWRGREDIFGKTILIYSEQGIGDVIQFCRYLPFVRSLGAKIVFEVPKYLIKFVSTINCEMTIIAKGDPLPEFQAYCPIMSLPYVFKTEVESIPADIPYLYADIKNVSNWNVKLGQKDRMRVGVVWQGSITNTRLLKRSMQLENLLPIFKINIEWHSLQKEYLENDFNLLEQHPEIIQHQHDLNDFADTAALIECMDLVISVDTSVAHVAGAIGKPVWIMLPHVEEYRWMLDREDSPWYPTAKLFRQPKRGDWQSVVVSVQKSLLKMLQES